MLIDESTGGMQMDLQIGVFNGVNVGLWGNQCERTYAHPGTIRFRTGGVTGPGSYGPVNADIGFVEGDDSAIHLPELSMVMPLPWYGWSCLEYDSFVYVDSTWSESLPPTTCSWTIEQDPGRFTLDCTDTRVRTGIDAGSGGHEFHLAADCDVRTTGG